MKGFKNIFIKAVKNKKELLLTCLFAYESKFKIVFIEVVTNKKKACTHCFI